MIKKTYDIAIKIGRDDIITAPAIVVQNDYDVYTLNIKVFDGNTEIDYEELDAATITFALSNGAVVQSDPDRLTLSSSGISYDMGTDEISCPGQVIASVQLFGTDNERLTTARFKFTVQQDLITPGAVQSDSKFPLLQQLMTEVQQLKHDIVELQIPDNSIMDTKLSDAAGQIKARLAELLDDFTSLSGQFDAHKADTANYGEFTISANQSIPTTAPTQILFNTTVKANPSLYELQPSGKIKILKAGTYEVKLIVTFAANATGFRRTNNISKQMTVPAATGVNISVFSSALFDASVGYETATTVTQTSGGALDLIAGQLQTCIQIRKVS